MKKVSFAVAFMIVLAMLLLPVLALAQLAIGHPTPVAAPFCTTVEAAVKVAKADSEGGPEAAMKVFAEADECGFARTVVVPLSVEFVAKTARGATVRVLAVVVDIGGGQAGRAFMLTDTDVAGLPPA